VVTQTEPRHAADVPQESSEAIEWLRRNAVTLVGLALIGVSLWWKAAFLAHFYFRQDDFLYWDRAFASGFSWSYLMTAYGGHLLPGDFAIVWVLARISFYDWTLTSTVTVLLFAASGLAMLRLLRMLFGNRPAILIPLVVGLFTPLTLSALSFWAALLNSLPLQLAMFMAANAHVLYVRTGRFRHAAAAASWLAIGMAAADAGAAVPLLLFALTSAFLLPAAGVAGSWRVTAVAALKKFWRAWVLYAALVVAYIVIFVIQLSGANQHPTKPGLFSGVLTYAWDLVGRSFIPAMFGGPLEWYSIGNFAYALTPIWLIWATWAVAAVVIVASLWFRRHAWRAWAILAGWLLIADIIPVVIGRVSLIAPAFLGLDLHYLADSVPVLVLCLSLAFWPVVGESKPYRARRPARVPRYAVVCALIGCFLAGSIWSAQTYIRDTSSSTERSYIATASAAVRQVQPGTTVISQPVPSDIMDEPLFSSWGYTSAVIGPLVPHSQHLTWTLSPAGVIPRLMLFDSLGRLRTAVLEGPSSSPPTPAAPVSRSHSRLTSRHATCWPVGTLNPTRIPVEGSLYRWIWTALVDYSGPATKLQLQFGGKPAVVAVPAGHHEIYMPATGSGSAVTVRALSPAPGACISRLTVGSLQPSRTAYPVPFFPVK
jgi:hypothetical protein